MGALALAAWRACCRRSEPLRAAAAADRAGGGADRAPLRAGRARRRRGAVLCDGRPVRRDHRLFHRARPGHLPQRRGGAADRDRRGAAAAAAAGPARGGRRAVRQLGASADQRHVDRGAGRPVRARPAARRGVEPVRRADAGRGLGAGGAGQGSWGRRAHHDRLRHRRRGAARSCSDCCRARR